MFRDYLKLRRYVKPRWRALAVGMLCLVFNSLSSGASFAAIVPLLDRIFSRQPIVLPERLPGWLAVRIEGLVAHLNSQPPETLLHRLLLFILGMICLRAVSFYLQSVFLKRFGLGILAGIRSRLYEKIVRLPYLFFTRERSGTLTTRITTDVGMLQYALSEGYSQFFLRLCETGVFFFIMFHVDPKMSLLAILIFPPLLIPVLRIAGRLRVLARGLMEHYARVGNVIHESVYGQQVIKAFNLERLLTRRFDLSNTGIFKAEMAVYRRIALIVPLTEILGAVGMCFVVLYGSRLILTGKMDGGFFFLFLAAMMALISPLKAVGTIYGQLRQASSALPRIYELLDLEHEGDAPGKLPFPGVRESIEFRCVTFSFDARPVLKSISFTARAGEKIGIAGMTGAGKTTLINLLMRFYEPTGGSILIDGRDIREYSVVALRQRIGLVSQEPIIFQDSIRRNISLEEEDDAAQVEEAARIANAAGFIEHLPEGLETPVGERGTTLSGGQRQLLMIARAVYRNPSVLILDEASASLDAASERQVQEALAHVMEGRTVLIIAHRLSTLRSADRILVLQDGTIVEEGPHHELLRRDGVYARLWRTQFSA